jgi:hypothetical protein
MSRFSEDLIQESGVVFKNHLIYKIYGFCSERLKFCSSLSLTNNNHAVIADDKKEEINKQTQTIQKWLISVAKIS